MVKHIDKKTGKEYRKYAELLFRGLKETLSQIPTEHTTKEADLLRELEAATTVQEMVDQVAVFLNDQ